MPKRKVSIVLELTPQQIKSAYKQLLEKENEDWFYLPEVTEELLKRRYEGRNELKIGKTTSLEDFKKE